MDAAVRYSQAHFPKFVENMGRCPIANGLLAISRRELTSNLKYAQMQSKEAWQKNIQASKVLLQTAWSTTDLGFDKCGQSSTRYGRH